MPDVCPTTSSALKLASDNTGCSGKLLYHCLRNEKGELTERCLDPSWIQKNYCAEFNSAAQRVDAEKCNGDLGICPGKTYLSNEVMSYSACVRRTATGRATEQGNYSRTSDMVYTSTASNDGTLKSSTGSTQIATVPAILSIVFIFIAVVAVCAFVYIIRRKRGGGKRRKKDNHAEHRPSTEEEGSPFFNEDFPQDGKIEEENNKPNDNPPNSKIEREDGTTIDSSTNCKPEEEECKRTGSTNADKDEERERLPQPKSVLHEMYYKTATGEYLESLLSNPTSVFIVGAPGGGKTTLAIQSCRKFTEMSTSNAKFWILKEVGDMALYSQTCEKNCFVLLDDALEILNQYPERILEYTAEILKLSNELVEKGGSRLLVTISGHTYEKFKKELSTLNAFNVINLLSDFQLISTDRHGILKVWGSNYPKLFRQKEEMTVTKIIELGKAPSDGIGFPLACLLFFRHTYFTSKKETFFKNIKYFIMEYLRGLKESKMQEERYQYCTIIYACLKGEVVDSENGYDDNILRLIAVNSGINDKDLKINTDSCLLKEYSESRYKILHEKIHQMIFVAFAYRCTGLVINHAETRYLLTFMRKDDSETREQFRSEGLLCITKYNHKLLIERLSSLEMTSLEQHVLF